MLSFYKLCALSYITSTGQMHDKNCNILRSFVCKRHDGPIVPVTTTAMTIIDGGCQPGFVPFGNIYSIIHTITQTANIITRPVDRLLKTLSEMIKMLKNKT